jgi:hypothetical protein
VKTDVSIDNDVKNAFHQTKEAFGRVPDLILFCSAMLEPPKLVHETPADEWWSYMVCLPLPVDYMKTRRGKAYTNMIGH